jgi:molybdopterin-guanine dinucleotide biosynthesis protein A
MGDLGAIVLCGGRSSRMGRAKAWLPWRGRPMVVHVVELLRRVVSDVVVVTSAELDLPPLDARIVCDDTPGEGPLVGLAMGLEAVEAELAFVTGTDVPFLSEALVRAVLSQGGAAAPVVDGFVQTLAAAYPKSAARTARLLLAQGRRRPLDLLEAEDYVALAAENLPDLESLQGFNTPEAYLEAVRSDDPRAQATLEFVGRPRRLAGVDSLPVDVGRLEDVLAHAPKSLELVAGGRVAAPFIVSLGGRDFVRDASIPIGAGERVIVLDASAGG